MLGPGCNGVDDYSSTYALGGSSNNLVGGGGGQIGCNWQDQNLVYGIEGDATFFRSHASFLGQNDTDYFYQSKTDWIATARGRVGIAAGTNGATMLYLTAGLAFGNVKTGISSDCCTNGPNQISDTRVGWTAGFGVERMITHNWTVKAEALYVDLGSTNFNDSAGYNLRLSHEFVMGKVGLNYKF